MEQTKLYVSNEMLNAAVGDEKTMKGYVELIGKNLMFKYRWSQTFHDHLNEMRATSVQFTLSKLGDYDKEKHGSLFTYIAAKLKYKMFQEYKRLEA
jgi:hypothetical protein